MKLQGLFRWHTKQFFCDPGNRCVHILPALIFRFFNELPESFFIYFRYFTAYIKPPSLYLWINLTIFPALFPACFFRHHLLAHILKKILCQTLHPLKGLFIRHGYRNNHGVYIFFPIYFTVEFLVISSITIAACLNILISSIDLNQVACRINANFFSLCLLPRSSIFPSMYMERYHSGAK